MFSSNDQKSRQSSGGRSFFGRRKEKVVESKAYDDMSLYPEAYSGPNSAQGSKSSRHSRQASDPMDMDHGADGGGLSMTAGVITSIPYDSLSPSKTPIPVDYLPKKDQVPARKDPLPHHLNKGGGDFHQYPAWEPPQRTMTNGSMSSHPTGPRPPPPHTSQPGSALTRDRHATKSTAVGGSVNGSQATNSYSTAESSSNARNSFDQASIYSTVSSTTKRSSIFSSDNTSHTAIPTHVHESMLRPGSSHSSVRQSTASAWNSHHVPSYNSATSFTPEGFHLPRPSDDAVIEQQFVALMHKRGWHNLPDQAKRQMMAYPPGKSGLWFTRTD